MTELAYSTLVGLLDGAPESMLAVDEAGLIVMVNAQALRLFGYRRDELIGRPVEILIRLADSECGKSFNDLQLPG